ncbi:hypothetical protein ACFP1Z_16170 [Streptomyces gamaensis]|uniref:Uncharacterized protein n=1 Tax=Streptomyces gamaensis TaxID=1763542 RepID=A0ABW0YYN1_9ACTN
MTTHTALTEAAPETHPCLICIRLKEALATATQDGHTLRARHLATDLHQHEREDHA